MSSPQIAARDRCKGCRTTYNAVVRAIAANSIISILIAGIPNYILITLIASQFSYIVHSLFSSASYTILSVLLIAWIIAGVSTMRKYPNLLTVSIFVYKCLAHWSLVSLIIVTFYGWQYVPLNMMWSLIGTLFPLIIALYICGDILERVRARLFAEIEQAHSTTTTVDGAFATTGKNEQDITATNAV